VKETYGKVSLKNLGSTIRVIATNLAGVTDVEAMQLVQPVWYWLHSAQTAQNICMHTTPITTKQKFQLWT